MNDLGEIGEDLTDEEKSEWKSLSGELSEAGKISGGKIEDVDLKKRVAEFCLKIVEETPLVEDGLGIRKTSYVVASFMKYEYCDELDEIVGLAGELELPESHVSGNVGEMFEKMKQMLKSYLDRSD